MYQFNCLHLSFHFPSHAASWYQAKGNLEWDKDQRGSFCIDHAGPLQRLVPDFCSRNLSHKAPQSTESHHTNSNSKTQ